MQPLGRSNPQKESFMTPIEKKREEKQDVGEASTAPAIWEPFRELSGWSPFRTGGSFARRFERLLEEIGDLEGAHPFGSRVLAPLDVAESGGQYTLSIELPGASQDDVTIEQSHHRVTIRGEKKSEREEEKEHVTTRERVYGSFSRTFTLPDDADADRLHASFKDGVLTLVIPKSEEVKPKTIAVKAG